jgi:signal transduction histidine kinase
VLLGRLRIRAKLALLVAIPLLAVTGLIVPVAMNLIDNVRRAASTDTAATVAGQVGPLLLDLQQERLLVVGYLLGAVDQDSLSLQISAVNDRSVDLKHDLTSSAPAAVRAAIDKADGLAPTLEKVRQKAIEPAAAVDAYVDVLDGLVDSLDLPRHADATTSAGRDLLALDALLRMDESNNEGTAILAMMSAGQVGALFVRYHEEQTEYKTYLDRFGRFGTAHQQDLYNLVRSALNDRLGQNFDDAFAADPVATMAARPLGALFPSLQSFTVLGTFVEKALVDDATALVGRQRQQQFNLSYGLGAIVLLVIIVVAVLVASVARAVAVPLGRLTRSADRVAHAGEQELRRVADDEGGTVEPVRLDVLDVNARDEIGDLARAFERVQNTAAQLVERQVHSQRNVAEMFGHIGRRTQNLVGRQVNLIDRLEGEEIDPQRLEQLYRLDHLSNRLRRSADSLVVISGADRAEDHLAPVRLMDVARLALAEIEEYTRVDVDIPLDLTVAPAFVSDMVLICAELLENATNFSPPITRVDISARPTYDGARLVIVDHGIGMPDGRLAEENARIGRRERLDIVPTRVLGLFVVGRLARRHGLGVTFTATSGGGVTATVEIGTAHLIGGSIRASTTVGTIENRGIPAVAELEAMIAVPVAELVPRNPQPSAAQAFATRPRIPQQRAPESTELNGNSPAEPTGSRPAPAHAVADTPADPPTGRLYASWPQAYEADRTEPPAEPAGDGPSSGDEQSTGPQVSPIGEAFLGRASAVGQPGRVNGRPVPPAGPAAYPIGEIRDWRPWNAFEIGSRSLPADPPAPTSPSGLRQRVPGARLPTGPANAVPANAMPADAPSAVDAFAARDLVEAFESGVRRAEDVAGSLPPIDVVPSAAPPAQAGGWPRTVQPLRRRVPGETLSPADTAPRRSVADAAVVRQDPNAARSLVDEFESGVARALRDAADSTDSEEGTPR